jgi:hypothetical protein
MVDQRRKRTAFTGYDALPDESFIVICRADKIGRRNGPYVIATRQTFASAEAAQAYAGTVNASRQPVVVAGRWFQLRTPR